jgi:FdhD protein
MHQPLRRPAADASMDVDYPASFAFDIARPAAVLRFDGERVEACDDHVVEEAAVALAYNGLSHAVMLATPAHLAELALGFTLTEGIVADVDEIGDIEVRPGGQGIEVNIDIPLERLTALKGRRRTLASRSGCGICGTESLDGLARSCRRIDRGAPLSPAAVRRALRDFSQAQDLHRLTGAAHGVAWADRDGAVVTLREDVGRHNALDKLIGWMVGAGVDPSAGFVVTSSRASYEMTQKAVAAGVGCMVAISAPTGMAVRMAAEAGLALAGFARGDRLTVYSHADHFGG